MHRSCNIVAAILTATLAAAPTYAGFTGTSGSDIVNVSAAAPAIGNTFAIHAGTLATYTPDTPADPQILGGDLDRYGYTLNTVGVTANLDGSFAYTGTYELFYNLDGNNTRDLGDLRVSSGTATLDLRLVAQLGGQTLQVTSGSLSQILGPEIPAFADLSYGGVDLGLIGLIEIPLSPGTQGTASLTFRQLAVVPEPGAFAAIAGVAMVALRRNRTR